MTSVRLYKSDFPVCQSLDTMSANRKVLSKAADRTETKKLHVTEELKDSREKKMSSVTEKQTNLGATENWAEMPDVEDPQTNEDHAREQTQKTMQPCTPEQTRMTTKRTRKNADATENLDVSAERKDSRGRQKKSNITEDKSKLGAKANSTGTPDEDERVNEHPKARKRTHKTKTACAPEKTKTLRKQTEKGKKMCSSEETKTTLKQTKVVKDLGTSEQTNPVRKRTKKTKNLCTPEQTQTTLKQTKEVNDSCTPEETKTLKKQTEKAKNLCTPEQTQTTLKQKKEVKDMHTPEEPKATFNQTEVNDLCTPEETKRTLKQTKVKNLCIPEDKKTVKKRTQTKNLSKKILKDVLQKLTVPKSDISKASKCINNIREIIVPHLKKRLSWCKDLVILNTGSYYEKVKICEPDEFDVMLTVPVDRVELQEFSEDGAFHTVKLKRSPNHPLKTFISEDRILKASEMLQKFRTEIIAIIKNEQQLKHVTVQRKKKGCPAVTLLVSDQGKNISVDFVLGLEVKSSWPPCTRDGFKINKWLSKKEKLKLKKTMPYYLVPKYKGIGSAEKDGVKAKDTWRLSFSHVEKEILRNHGKAKTCCEDQKCCCRKDCLKLLKYLLNLLKKKHPNEAEGLCSYHAKTTLFHACAERVKDSDWAISKLSECFQLLLKDFEKHLRNQQLFNFFIPSHNLFKVPGQSKKRCNFLADCIKEQYDHEFPLFQEDLKDNKHNASSPEL